MVRTLCLFSSDDVGGLDEVDGESKRVLGGMRRRREFCGPSGGHESQCGTFHEVVGRGVEIS